MRHVGIVGAGTIGVGIAALFLRHDVNVTLFDHRPGSRTVARARIARRLRRYGDSGSFPPSWHESTLMRLSIAGEIADLSAVDIVIEAVGETAHVKKNALAELDVICESAGLLVTTTACLSITKLAAATRQPPRIIGMHFLPNSSSVKFVEIVPGMLTDRAAIERGSELAHSLDVPALVVKNRPGFLIDRVTYPYFSEALRLVENHATTYESVDAIMTAMGFQAGPFALMDAIGLDNVLSISRALFEGSLNDSRYRPHPLQAEMVDAGLLGRKSGRGFYEYSKQ